MAAEGDPNVRVEGSARLVGDMPSSSITPQSSASATGNRSETSPSITDITTTTASNRQGKQTTTPQVSGHFILVHYSVKADAGVRYIFFSSLSECDKNWKTLGFCIHEKVGINREFYRCTQ